MRSFIHYCPGKLFPAVYIQIKGQSSIKITLYYKIKNMIMTDI